MGIGLKHVLLIKASISESYHIFKQPDAPAPIATKVMLIIALTVSKFEFEERYPTAQVNITRDITLGFIKRIKDFVIDLKSIDFVVLLFKILLVTVNLR